MPELRNSCRQLVPDTRNLMVHYGYPGHVKAEWISTTDATFVADLGITGIDDERGVVELATSKISTMQVSISGR